MMFMDDGSLIINCIEKCFFIIKNDKELFNHLVSLITWHTLIVVL